MSCRIAWFECNSCQYRERWWPFESWIMTCLKELQCGTNVMLVKRASLMINHDLPWRGAMRDDSRFSGGNAYRTPRTSSQSSSPVWNPRILDLKIESEWGIDNKYWRETVPGQTSSWRKFLKERCVLVADRWQGTDGRGRMAGEEKMVQSGGLVGSIVGPLAALGCVIQWLLLKFTDERKLITDVPTNGHTLFCPRLYK